MNEGNICFTKATFTLMSSFVLPIVFPSPTATTSPP
uniref:Uncharacterized protein n=1 Tax=Rhizophora mucronata TaxID=61149 RepID=A0A2P2M9X9_RHIMU